MGFPAFHWQSSSLRGGEIRLGRRISSRGQAAVVGRRAGRGVWGRGLANVPEAAHRIE